MKSFAPLLAIAALMASPAVAGSYSARLTTAQTQEKIIGKNISWSCAADLCRGASEASRPVVLCQDLAKRAGAVVSFQSDGRPLSAEELAKCNTAAKPVAAPPLATAQ
ncbi:CC_3452 family protein [Sphingomonas sp. LY160]|uniref:CC_3452 family protein n=1 Tax=Sphingomonas sp. LY160 TaxID=3095342 RepID=UPI002ADEF97A|nr:hypothetical protein [Sphingomonas sp. LY160]MEA1072584.1 hypothetical protein [Sphingomonas sp. LY160]